MKGKAAARINIFILELTIIVLIFALAGAISVGLFAKAHTVGQFAENTTIAMMKTQTLAEAFKSQDSFIDFTDLSGISPWPQYFDQDWEHIQNLQGDAPPIDAIYSIEALVSTEKTDAGLMATVSYKAYDLSKGRDLLYTLDVQKYYPGQSGGRQ